MSAGERPPTRLWREALAQFDDLLQQPPAQRAAVLNRVAQTQPQLHSLLVSLLAAEAQADSAGFLEPAAAPATACLQAGVQLGPYRVLSQLGAGGMGEVWLARRDDGMYDGEVAIKTLHPYFAGGALRERFRREAQILGRLTHPNIARLLDAGISADGIVYLVLEYVRGTSIDVWCNSQRLAIAARLRLFADVCAAVAHAHAHLIVHRDIKPSNILVTDAGEVKLLDFGVAKLLEAEREHPATELTRLTGRLFTPEFAAPEQILGEPITTATDVYSLGVLLYALLCGSRPFAVADAQGFELERAVLKDEPVRMSRAVASSADQRVSQERASQPGRLRRELEGDLDNIVMKTLAKRPADRYPSVLALSEDIARHLANQPVQARGESFAYRARKFVRRHRVVTTAVTLTAVALAAGVVGVMWQAQVARTEARKATAIRDFLVGVFERNSLAHPDGARARQTTAEELLAQSAQQIRSELKDVPEVRTELLGVMAGLYASLDMQRDALALLTDKLAGQRAEFGDDDIAVAKTLTDVAYSQIQIGDYAAAQRSASEALRIFAALGDDSSLEHGLALGNLGQAAYRLGQGQDGTSRRHYEAALQLIAAHHPRNKGSDSYCTSSAV